MADRVSPADKDEDCLADRRAACRSVFDAIVDIVAMSVCSKKLCLEKANSYPFTHTDSTLTRRTVYIGASAKAAYSTSKSRHSDLELRSEAARQKRRIR